MTVRHKRSERQGLTVLSPEDRFRFACRPELGCFTRCCRDTTIFLTPYDILRLKNALGIASDVFLREYTTGLVNDAGLPVVFLKLNPDAAGSCPFVTADGCRVYPHRPWACRIYPLQPERAKTAEKNGREFYSIMKVPFCRGFSEDQVNTVARWQETQGIPIYREMEALFKTVTLDEFLSDKCIENDHIRNMVYMACYDLDRFRRFVFESSFLKRFEIDSAEAENMRRDDVALYRFAMKWIEFGLVGQHTLTVKPEVMTAKKRELGVR